MILNKVLDKETGLELINLGKELHQESKYKNTPYNEDRCWKLVWNTQQNPDFFLAYDEDFRGFIVVQKTTHYFSGEIWVADLAFYVKPEFRGSNVASELVQAAEKWAKGVGAKEFTIFHNTGINIEKAQRFFHHQGFQTAGYIFTKEL